MSIANVVRLVSFNSLVGLPVVCAARGKRLGSIADIVFLPGQTEIHGIILLTNSFLGKKIFLPMDIVRIIGEHAVILEGDEDIIDRYTGKQTQNRLLYGSGMIGLQVVKDDGVELGIVSDLILNADNTCIEGYEISKGFIDDLVDGRSVLPSCGESVLDESMLVVSLHQVFDMLPYDKGIKRMLNKDNSSKARSERMDCHDDQKQVRARVFSRESFGDSGRSISYASPRQQNRQENNEQEQKCDG